MRKGQFILSDLTWFGIFIIFATLIFLFFFRPLHNEIERGVVIGNAISSADYTAAALPRMQPGTAKYGTVAELVQALVKLRGELPEDEWKKTEEYSLYQSFLNSTFNAPIATGSRGTRHIIVLEHNNAYVTCNAYFTMSDVCDDIHERKMRDTDTGLFVPRFDVCSPIERGQVCTPDKTVDVGTSFIPTENGPATIIVLIGGSS